MLSDAIYLNSLSKFLASVCLLSAFSGAFAVAEDGDSALFCSDPVTAICGPGNRDGNARAKKLDAVLAAADRLAIQDVKRAFPDFKRRKISKESIENMKDHELRDQLMGAYYESQLLSVQRHLGNSKLAASMHFDRIKARLLTVVDRHRAIDRTERLDMIANLKNAQLVDASDVLLGRSGTPAMRDAVIESCKENGLEENAFADTIENKTYVIVCPGDYLGGMDRTERGMPASEKLAASEVWTLGHETGHHMDSEKHPISYKNFRQCIGFAHKRELKGPVNKYMAEMTADHWGNEELASYLTKFPESARLKVVRASLMSICESKDDGEHPSGNFRIEMLRRNPRIHKIMNCPTPDQSQIQASDMSCTLSGKWSQVLWKKGGGGASQTIAKGSGANR